MRLKLDVAMIIAIMAGAALWVEHEHRIVIDAPGETDARQPACPDTDSVPYSARCLEFLEGATVSGMTWRINADDGRKGLAVSPSARN